MSREWLQAAEQGNVDDLAKKLFDAARIKESNRSRSTAILMIANPVN